MRFLMDTHIFIALINKEKQLNKQVIKIISDPAHTFCISIASLWEITVKINIGKLNLTRNIKEMYDLIEDFPIQILSIQKEHLDTYLSLPLIHKDPFDRLIIAQALTDDLVLITDDQYIRNYPNLKLFQ